MFKIFPDLGMVVEKFLYPILISYTKVTSSHETSLVMVTALFAEQVLPILKEHQQGAKANGLTDEQLGLVYTTVRCLAKAFGLDQHAFIDDIQEKYY
jgi:alkylhydroperoxidase/carboxymuconolactone decarboxylase family protein YurZ